MKKAKKKLFAMISEKSKLMEYSFFLTKDGCGFDFTNNYKRI